MKYKAGDKVRVRKGLEIGGRYQMEDTGIKDTFVLGMHLYLGKVVTIHSIDGPKYRINEDNGKYMWTDEMFERLGARITKVIYNPPATIVWFDDGDKIVSKADKGDKYDWKHGLALCILKKRMPRSDYNRFYPYFDRCDMVVKRNADGKVCRDEKGKVRYIKNAPLWDVLVRKYCPNGKWEKIKKEWKK